MARDPYLEQLVGWEKAVAIETRGRKSGRTTVAAVGFVEEPDGSLLVAAGDPGAHWAANLRADPRCVARVGTRRTACLAEELDGTARARAITELILKYGTPAERLGAGPAFLLRPETAAPVGAGRAVREKSLSPGSPFGGRALLELPDEHHQPDPGD